MIQPHTHQRRIPILALAPAAAVCLPCLGLMARGTQTPSPASLNQKSGGLNGYISFRIETPPDQYRAGVSFYAGIWPLLEKPLDGFQIGLPSTWIIPDNRDFKQPLCPPGTVARDNWPERGPYYRDVFQTIEGGLGYWGSTQYGSAVPKYRMNGTPDGYNHEISSPGWGFGQTNSLAGDGMGIAQLSNRLIVPPDGFTFKPLRSEQLLGNAWMSLPFSTVYHEPGHSSPALTGDQCWTLFLNAANFKGPVAFWIPETWSRLSRRYHTIDGRGLDARPALMNSGAMEFNTVPYFEAADSNGTVYSRVPRLLFPPDKSGRTVLMQDVTMYSASALSDRVQKWLTGSSTVPGKFDAASARQPNGAANQLSFRQGSRNVPLTGYDRFVKTTVAGSAYCLEWSGQNAGILPEYYKQSGDKRIAIAPDEVPASSHLAEQGFRPARRGRPYVAFPDAAWTIPGPARGPYRLNLTDGSTISYSWYRFVDQPALQSLGLSEMERRKLQSFVEKLHARWRINEEYMPPPSSGSLAALDAAQIVRPPKDLSVGYVPIITRQEPAGPSTASSR